ncbi:unnamed protein product [Protopolystoma xenopodis]|uniref:Uncharacterized protein n=1 Tax=Protopolystoma xenopodis TaxID=117903 RepID=A0A448WYS4_9PLAT|nr:unnamed protein product [Protopolystoma xenopodis]
MLKCIHTRKPSLPESSSECLVRPAHVERLEAALEAGIFTERPTTGLFCPTPARGHERRASDRQDEGKSCRFHTVSGLPSSRASASSVRVYFSRPQAPW